MEAEEEFFDFVGVGVPALDFFADVFEVEKFGIVFVERLDGGTSVVRTAQHATGGGD